MQPTLLVLAAGMGSRYGGMKQTEPFGPGGATIMDYSIFDAVRAGFGRVVFVIRPDMLESFRATIGARYERRLAVDYALQSLDALPGGRRPPAERTKPWGTGQAVLVAADKVQTPFAVVNADDFYGRQSLAALADFLRTPPAAHTPSYAMVGYRLRETLSEGGQVSRGVCRLTGDGWLESVTETHKLEADGADARSLENPESPRTIPGDTLVSMNLWGFHPDFFEHLARGFEAFLDGAGASATAEFYLPFMVQDLVAAGRVRVRVIPSRDRWFGVTNRADKAIVETALQSLVDEGVYPARLWN